MLLNPKPRSRAPPSPRPSRVFHFSSALTSPRHVMLSPTALRLNATCRIPCHNFRRAFSGHGTLPALPRPQWPAANKTWSYSRAKSTVVAQAGKGPRFKYPEYLNVYRAGSTKTLFMGFFRIVAISCFPIGCVYATAVFFSPDHSSWWTIPIVLGSAVPMIAMMLTTGPFVHAIKVRLPPSVRTSKEELIRFADNTPSNTEVRLACMRSLPWPTDRDVEFGLLRKYRPSFKRGYSNLEYVPEHTGKAEKYEGTWWHNMAMNFFGRFMVDNVVQDRSSAPGVWIKMWRQIPELGSQNDPVKKITEGRRRVVMANRPQRTIDAPRRSPVRPGRLQR